MVDNIAPPVTYISHRQLSETKVSPRHHIRCPGQFPVTEPRHCEEPDSARTRTQVSSNLGKCNDHYTTECGHSHSVGVGMVYETGAWCMDSGEWCMDSGEKCLDLLSSINHCQLISQAWYMDSGEWCLRLAFFHTPLSAG